MKLTISDVRRILKWVDQKSLTDATPMEIILTSSPIGDTLEVKVETSENEGIWVDLTDYDSW